MNIYFLFSDVTNTDMFIAFLCSLAVFVIGILFGYSINSKYRKKVVEFEEDNVKLKSSVSNLEAQIEEAKKARSNADDEIVLLRNRVRDRDIRIRETEGKMAMVSKKLDDNQAMLSQLKAEKEIVLPSSKTKADKVASSITEIKTNVKSKDLPKVKKAKKDSDKKSTSKAKKSSSKKIESKKDSKATGKKKRGRPAGSKNKATAAKTTSQKSSTKTVKKVEAVVAEPKRRGRPAGSKNKTQSTAKAVTAAKPASKRGRPAGSKNKTTKALAPSTTRRRGRPAGSTNKPKVAPTGKRGRAKDDLTLIEGIGPKMEEALRNGGIRTFNKISNTTPEKLKSILVKANTRFGIAATDSWPTQAKLAAKGALKELKAYQDTLNRGR